MNRLERLVQEGRGLLGEASEFSSIHDAAQGAHIPSHERCPDGSHWNEKQGKCLPLPAGLHQTHHDALRELTHARMSSVFTGERDTKRSRSHGGDPNNDPEAKRRHGLSIAGHRNALMAHRKAAKELGDAGFKHLAHEHGVRGVEQAQKNIDVHTARLRGQGLPQGTLYPTHDDVFHDNGSLVRKR